MTRCRRSQRESLRVSCIRLGLTLCRDKILNMDGGGEDSVAYILLYRSVCPSAREQS